MFEATVHMWMLLYFRLRTSVYCSWHLPYVANLVWKLKQKCDIDIPVNRSYFGQPG